MKKIKLLRFKTYFVKDKEEGKPDLLFIEGFANRAMIGKNKVIDRGMENIPGEEWSIKEWMKNPVILFNHDRDVPIGKGVDAKITDQGLWIKAQISNSSATDITKARDLIKEGIISTFSVGIDVDSEELAEDKSITLKGVNLLETSAVTIPMNQESFFSISQKDLKEKPLDVIASEMLFSSGHFVASTLHKAMHAKSLKDEAFDRVALLAHTGAKEILAGQGDMTDELSKFFQTQLDLAVADIKEAQKSELALKESDGSGEDDEGDNDEGVGKEGDATIPVGTTDQLSEDLGQPGLQALQQMTVMLGQLIAETQKTQKLLEGLGLELAADENTLLAEDGDEDDEGEDENPFGKASDGKELFALMAQAIKDGMSPDEAMKLGHSVWHVMGNPCEEDEKFGDELLTADDTLAEDGENTDGEEDEEMGKSLDMISSYKSNLETKLARFAI